MRTAAGQTVAAWAGDTGVFAAVASRDRVFGSAQRLSRLEIANDSAQLLAMDDRGDALVAWQQQYRGGPSAGSLFVSYRPASAKFGPATRIARNAGAAAIGLDGHGNATIAWEQFQSPRGSRNVTINLVERRAVGRYSPVHHVAVGTVSLSAMAVNARGQAVILWEAGSFPAVELLAATRSGPRTRSSRLTTA